MSGLLGGPPRVDAVGLSSEARAVLGSAPIGMLALRAGRLPVVNPAAFHFASGSLWMTTSRYAAKIMSAKRDPRAAFLVDGGSQALLLRGALEVYDPLSVSSQVRAMLDGPGYLLGMAGYALKNATYFAGYLLDLTHIPREWLPYNRVVLRLRPSDSEVIDVPPFPAAQAARVPAVPAEVSRRLAGVPRGYACWLKGGMPVLRPAVWEVGHGVVTVAPSAGKGRSGSVGALACGARSEPPLTGLASGSGTESTPTRFPTSWSCSRSASHRGGVSRSRPPYRVRLATCEWFRPKASLAKTPTPCV